MTLDRETWLHERRTLVTASDCAAILGVDPDRGPLAVYADKVADVSPVETGPMRRGRTFEAAIAEDYALQTQRPLTSVGEYVITRHPDLPWLGATLDRVMLPSALAPAPSGVTSLAPAPLQIKMALGSGWRWAEDTPPLHYVVQVQIEIACLGATWGGLAALVGPGPLATPDLCRDDAFLEAAIPVLEAFWHRVQRRDPPPADGTEGTAAAVRRLWATEDGATIALDTEDDVALVARWDAAKHAIHDHEAIVTECDTRLRARLGAATYGALPDGSFLTLKSTTRDSYTVKATTYRALRRWWPKTHRPRRTT